MSAPPRLRRPAPAYTAAPSEFSVVNDIESDDFDDDAPSLRASAGSGATTDSLSAEGVSSSGAAGGVNLNASWAAEFETPSSSTANADGSDDDGWAAFDTAPATGPVDSETDAPAAAESGRSSQGDPDLAI